MQYYCKECSIKYEKRFYFVDDICPKCGRYSSKPKYEIPRLIKANKVTPILAKKINEVIFNT